MRRYETIFILRPNKGEEEINRVVESMSQIITDEQGTIIELTHWGVKKLAYLIKKETLGHYIYCDYAGTPAAVSEIERKCRIDDVVLKYMTIKIAETIDTDGIQQAISAATEKAVVEEQEGTEGETAGDAEAKVAKAEE